MRLRSLFLAFLTGLSACALLPAQQPSTPTLSAERASLHRSSEWDLILPHLPDPATATAAQLELSGDVLNARRFPEDALDYYQFAMKRGGNTSELMKKIGVVRLELQQTLLARAIFQHCVQVSRNDAQAWNNLGAADYVMGAYSRSIHEYKRAVKLNKKSAVFHANLGMAYLSAGDTSAAQREFQIALELDPAILEDRSQGGVTLRALQVKDFARLCFQMAHLYVEQGRIQLAKVWLRRAGENGADLRAAMDDDRALRPLLKDPEFQDMIANTEALRKRVAVTNTAPLGAGNEPHNLPD
jgi:tetratricopeptide (TPR) repeat protein